LIDATTAVEKTYYFNLTVENSGSRPTQTTMTSHGIRINVKAATPMKIIIICIGVIDDFSFICRSRARNGFIWWQ